MSIAHSAEWVPALVRPTQAGPAVDWCHLGGAGFTDPFFEQTIDRAMRHPFNLLLRRSMTSFAPRVGRRECQSMMSCSISAAWSRR